MDMKKSFYENSFSVSLYDEIVHEDIWAKFFFEVVNQKKIHIYIWRKQTKPLKHFQEYLVLKIA